MNSVLSCVRKGLVSKDVPVVNNAKDCEQVKMQKLNTQSWSASISAQYRGNCASLTINTIEYQAESEMKV